MKYAFNVKEESSVSKSHEDGIYLYNFDSREYIPAESCHSHQWVRPLRQDLNIIMHCGRREYIGVIPAFLERKFR